MEAYQQRVVDEERELSEKRAKLYAFVTSNPLFKKLPADEQTRLTAQLAVMDQYAAILVDRINHFPKGAAA